MIPAIFPVQVYATFERAWLVPMLDDVPNEARVGQVHRPQVQLIPKDTFPSHHKSPFILLQIQNEHHMLLKYVRLILE